MKTLSIRQRIEGTPSRRMLREFLLNSGLFQIFLLLYIAVNDGVNDLFRDPANYLLLVSAVLQTLIIERWGRKSSWKNALFLLIAPTTYTIVDIAGEGWLKFLYPPYHFVYWGFSIFLVFFTLWRSTRPTIIIVRTILINILRTMLFPALYFITEVYPEGSTEILTIKSFITYWSIPGHAYILIGSVIFGFLIGINEASRNQSLTLLQHLAKRLHELIGWSLDEAFTESVIANKIPVGVQRVSVIIFFMDIRGFTKWSEEHELHEITEILNSYYEAAEQHIIEAGGSKPQFTGDEVMSWFTTDSSLFKRIQTLQAMTIAELQKYDLTVGIGVHFGEVVEGLIGSSTTKAMRITGDPVNTGARICDAALSGEILVSEAACNALSITTEGHIAHTILAKGKQHNLKVFSFSEAGSERAS